MVKVGFIGDLAFNSRSDLGEDLARNGDDTEVADAHRLKFDGHLRWEFVEQNGFARVNVRAPGRQLAVVTRGDFEPGLGFLDFRRSSATNA